MDTLITTVSEIFNPPSTVYQKLPILFYGPNKAYVWNLMLMRLPAETITNVH